MPNFKENIRFIVGLDILKKYEENPDIQDMGEDVYVGDMTKWEDIMTNQDIEYLKQLGWDWHEGGECLAYNKNIRYD